MPGKIGLKSFDMWVNSCPRAETAHRALTSFNPRRRRILPRSSSITGFRGRGSGSVEGVGIYVTGVRRPDRGWSETERKLR